VLDHAKRSELIEELAGLPERARAVVQGLDDAQLDTPYREGGWTVRQVIHHLADSHINAYVRFRLALTEDHPTFKPYQQDRWVELSDARALPVESSLGLLAGLHARWVHLLRSLPGAAWARSGYHPEHGDMTLDDLLVEYGRHGTNHVGQILELRWKRGW
jgi:hypothetical protein